jgi:hypothetical protein
MKALRALVAAILVLFFLPEAFAQNEFSAFWTNLDRPLLLATGQA